MGVVYGYCRSNRKMGVDRQERNIQAAYQGATIFIDRYKVDIEESRPQFQKLIVAVKAGDTIVFNSVSQIGCNAADSVEQYMELFKKSIELVFLNEKYISTTVYKEALSNCISDINNSDGNVADKTIERITNMIMKLAERQITIAFEHVDELHKSIKSGIDKITKEHGFKMGAQRGMSIHTKKEYETKPLIEKYNKDFDGELDDNETMKLVSVSRRTYWKYKEQLEQARRRRGRRWEGKRHN